MEQTHREHIEYLILSELLRQGSVTLPDICVLALVSSGARLTPGMGSILPPSRSLEVYHPENASGNNIIESISAHYPELHFSECADMYWDYMDGAIADGNILTIQGLGIINMSSLETIATSEELAGQLSPFVAPLSLPAPAQSHYAQSSGYSRQEQSEFLSPLSSSASNSSASSSSATSSSLSGSSSINPSAASSPRANQRPSHPRSAPNPSYDRGAGNSSIAFASMFVCASLAYLIYYFLAQ